MKAIVKGVEVIRHTAVVNQRQDATQLTTYLLPRGYRITEFFGDFTLYFGPRPDQRTSGYFAGTAVCDADLRLHGFDITVADIEDAFGTLELVEALQDEYRQLSRAAARDDGGLLVEPEWARKRLDEIEERLKVLGA